MLSIAVPPPNVLLVETLADILSRFFPPLWDLVLFHVALEIKTKKTRGKDIYRQGWCPECYVVVIPYQSILASEREDVHATTPRSHATRPYNHNNNDNDINLPTWPFPPVNLFTHMSDLGQVRVVLKLLYYPRGPKTPSLYL